MRRSRQLELERTKLREQQRLAEEKLRQAEADRLAAERARVEAEARTERTPPPVPGYEQMGWCSYDVPGCSPESEQLGYEVSYDQEKVYNLRRGGSYKQAMCNAWRFLENVPGLAALERGRLNYELSRCWDALGCRGNACYHLRESLKFRPQRGKGFKVTCETCESWGCPYCPGCR